ncbi:hypothetical protein MMH89_01825 [Candidatus Comchoanobacter bicostacola]|uniref:Outer membrane protein beta-barrel domain-containing protein n=1 Tax=Candidatus Comchoanobacter bicostacola TaxID=2919598 RepID=A0ABY5DN34_9GAMM|nr:hypothetical protein [Candidatus Comchoanobacter bicostacola]UTC24889.1 hypothetical protein MMH89_01825 [Candidatus Comchoanobacter bicostacola]
MPQLAKQFYRIFPLILTVALSHASQPHLYIGGTLGSRLTSILPEENTSPTTTLQTIFNVAGADAAANRISLEGNDTLKQNFIFAPSIGMTFPIENYFVIEGGASLDLKETSYEVKNPSAIKNLATIDRDIGITAALMLNISKQYAIGPMFSANILQNKSGMYGTSALEKLHTVYSYGIQSNYEINNSFGITIQCLTTFDQQLKVEAPNDATQNINLDYLDARLMITARFLPI